MAKETVDEQLRNDVMLYGESFEMKTAQGGRTRLDPRTVVIKGNADQRRTIDSLVELLSECRDAMPYDSPVWKVSDEEYKDLQKRVDAALALARSKE